MLANELSPTASILAQALPGSLAAPNGWRSEIVDGSSSPLPDDIGTDFIHTSSSAFDKHEEYKTLNTLDAPPIIFPSSNETSRTVNEIPFSTRFTPKTTTRSSSAVLADTTNESYKTFVDKDQRNILTNSLDQDLPPLVLHKTLPDNTVTYQQNVSVRYLQPPTPPPPGPIIIRKKLFHRSISLIFR